MRYVYSLLVVLLSPLVFLVFVWRYGLRRTVSGIGQRFMIARPQAPSKSRVWFHAASVGEVRALEPLLRAFPSRFPGVGRVLTTTTVTGRELAVKLALAEDVRLAPLDLTWCARRFLRSWGPSAGVFVETELWPNWIAAAGREKVPLLLVNGRISDKTAAIYRRLSSLWRPLFAHFFKVGVQTSFLAERFVAAGAPREKIAVTGNLKYDVALPDLNARPNVFRRYGFDEGDTVLVCGSTHGGEEREILKAIEPLWQKERRLKVVLAPRHAERSRELLDLIGKFSLSGMLRSDCTKVSGEPPKMDAKCLILDTSGELSEIYGLAAWAFVGGSLVPHGGQNPLEPARWAVPVLFGSHMENFREMAEQFLQEKAALRVKDAEELREALLSFVRDPENAKRMGASARRVAETKRGSVKANLDLLAQALA